MGARRDLADAQAALEVYGDALTDHHRHAVSCAEALKLARAGTATAVRLRDEALARERAALAQVDALKAELAAVAAERDAALAAVSEDIKGRQAEGGGLL